MTNWIYTDKELKAILKRNDDPDNEIESVKKTKAELIPHLKTTPCFRNLPSAVINSLEKSNTFHSFNRALDLVFDYADDNRIWLEGQTVLIPKS